MTDQQVVRCIACGRPALATDPTTVNVLGYIGTIYFCDPPCDEFRQRITAAGLDPRPPKR